MKKEIKIPFDDDGNAVVYQNDTRITSWRTNHPFPAKLVFKEFRRGRSAANALFEAQQRTAQGERFQVFLTDLAKMILAMKNGTISGWFVFCKRGQNYGVRLATKKEFCICADPFPCEYPAPNHGTECDNCGKWLTPETGDSEGLLRIQEALD